ncbi:kunitz-type U19-barytoxin-Tl1a-like [Maniola jurtina]|uniref:kunitz-type U19-barytoxin-Tl1a-like n=1 Tax=Maniola jurtina TaxID=191418 RepID=UPI001E68621C|nr:kunitz-type U19-barytoxin-Tl1a-like [Maniola jurtina]XP_045771657.1 kunitz-type U19-barytoxin-Tl1a-like [Maniola jurtina]
MLQILYYSCVFTINNIAHGTKLNDSLTTQAIREATSLPTTVDRITNVERGIGGSSSTLDAFQLGAIDGRKKKKTSSYIEKWDHWCKLQPKKGNCEKTLTKYYYDVKLDQCSPFIYSGCDGSKNNFDTLLDCERHCKGSNYMKIDNFSHSTFCYLQPEAGLCLALFTKYYYDVNENSCKQFVYGGCGGNLNKFDTMLSCMETCKGK